MIITISGLPGSGKSTVGKILAKKLGYEFMSMGDLRGKMAIDRGLTIDELNRLGEKEGWTDKEVDDYQREYGKTHDKLVVEGRLSFHFIPQSFKIFLTVNQKTAAARTMENRNERQDEKSAKTVEEAERLLHERIESDKKRYLKYYNLDYTDPKHYDLALDTTEPSIDEVVQIILDRLPKKM